MPTAPLLTRPTKMQNIANAKIVGFIFGPEKYCKSLDLSVCKFEKKCIKYNISFITQ